MNNKGFLATLEAVVAIVILFGFLLIVLNEDKKTNEGKTPRELDLTLKAITKEVQIDAGFRNAVLTSGIPNKQDTSRETLKKFIEGILPPFSPWTYAFKMCDKDENNCIFYPKEDGGGITIININQILPPDKSVYSDAIFLSVEDITSPTKKSIEEKDKIFRLYMWEK